MDYEVRVVSAAVRHLAAVQEEASLLDLSAKIIRLLDEVYAFLRGEAAPVTQTGHNIVVYLGKLPATIQAGVEVSGTFDQRARVEPLTTPTGEAARTLHVGPYSEIPAAHAAVSRWCLDQGLALAGPSWEIYGDWNEDPARLETEVYYLLG